jgi:hypothetical protein
MIDVCAANKILADNDVKNFTAVLIAAVRI